jgi:hypothetical protein
MDRNLVLLARMDKFPLLKQVIVNKKPSVTATEGLFSLLSVHNIDIYFHNILNTFRHERNDF